MSLQSRQWWSYISHLTGSPETRGQIYLLPLGAVVSWVQNIPVGKKRLLFENSINQILIKQLKLYSVVCYFIKSCMLSPNFKVALIFMFFNNNLYKSLVWCRCQGKQSASSEWVNIIIIIIIIIMIIIIIIIIIIILIIIIAFKGAIREFLQSLHSAANCLQHARSSGPGAIVCKSRATHRALITCNMSCYVPLGTNGQLSY